MAGEFEALEYMEHKLQEGQHRAEHRRDSIQDTLGVEAMDFQEFAKKNRSSDTNSNLLFGIPLALASGVVSFFSVNKIKKSMHDFNYPSSSPYYQYSPPFKEASATQKFGIAAIVATVAGFIPYLVDSIKRNNIKKMVKEYNTYLDDIAADGREARTKRTIEMQHPVQQEYDNGSPDQRSHTARIESSQSKNNETAAAGQSR